jgi:hypothetical protein
MKTTISILAAILLVHTTSAQLKTTAVCPTFSVDLLEGTINGLNCRSTFGEVKTTFPCFTKAVEETSGFECGGVFYKDRDINFFTERDYVEIGEKFKGKISQPFLGASRNSLFKWLGYPKIKDVNWDAFQTKYGILILYYNKAGKVNKLQMSSKSTDDIKLCE